MKEVHALADHLLDAWESVLGRTSTKILAPGAARFVWVSPFLYGKIRDGITEGAYIDGKTPSDGYPDFAIHLLGFRVLRDEALGPKDCRIVIREAKEAAK